MHIKMCCNKRVCAQLPTHMQIFMYIVWFMHVRHAHAPLQLYIILVAAVHPGVYVTFMHTHNFSNAPHKFILQALIFFIIFYANRHLITDAVLLFSHSHGRHVHVLVIVCVCVFVYVDKYFCHTKTSVALKRHFAMSVFYWIANFWLYCQKFWKIIASQLIEAQKYKLSFQKFNSDKNLIFDAHMTSDRWQITNMKFEMNEHQNQHVRISSWQFTDQGLYITINWGRII